MPTSVIKGHIIHAPTLGELQAIENGYIVLEGKKIQGIYPVLPEEYQNAPLTDYGERLIVPSFSDLHLHAPQYPMVGLGMDLQLLEWLETYTFKTESRFRDPAYARSVYRLLARDLIKKGTTRVCMFSSIHRASTHVLMEELEAAGVTGYVGKVNMDRSSPDYLRETTDQSLVDTECWIRECQSLYQNLKPIITPRFVPSCTDTLMRGLGKLAEKYDLRVQSHLSENLDEIAWVKSLCPDCEQYWEAYETRGLFRPGSVMAHCIYSDERERAAMKKHGVWAIHCPDSNLNIASGIAPIRLMLREGLDVALGSDIAGGALLSMLQTAANAIRVSKQRWLTSRKEEDFLTVAEAFYLLTSAGQKYFGAGPGFVVGDSFHAVVLDDGFLPFAGDLSPTQRLERLVYLGGDACIAACYSEGINRTVSA